MLTKTKDSYGNPMAVFELSTQNSNLVYMRVKKGPDFNRHQTVVVVSAKRFLALLQNDIYGWGHKFMSNNPKIMKSDYKYAEAVEGFSYGIANPVPLAKIILNVETRRVKVSQKKFFILKQKPSYIEKKVPYASFVNGITRTLWLFSNRVSSFPIVCDSKSAEHLHELAGDPAYPIWSFRDVFTMSDISTT